MDLPQAIDLNKTALVRIVAGLFTLLGLTADAAPGRIPGVLHRTILRVLRPAESAVRRLIVAVARTMDMQAIKLKASRPWPAGLVRAGKRKPGFGKPGPGKPRFAFRLFDPRQRFFRKPPRPKNQPRPRPRITFFRDGGYRTLSLSRELPAPKADGLKTSVHLVRRLKALKAALDDLPRQALRLARAQARRQTSPRLKLQGPLRPGPAPGSRRRPVQEIDHLLHRCDWLAREALPPVSRLPAISRLPDTS